MAADRPLKSLLIASLAGTAVAFSGVPLPAFRSGALSLSQSSAAASSAFSLGSAQSARKGALTGMTMSLSKDDYATAMSKAVENDRDLDHIFRNNKMWVKEQTKNDPDFFLRMSKGQSPKFLWIGCSDARVPANEIVGCGPGELFVHRNIANLVVNNDNSIQSVFQYAVEYLQVEHIIVCGHYQCGGVAASMNDADLTSPLEEWVRNIRDVYRLHKKELDSIEDKDLRTRRLVELNAQEQALNVYKTAVVQRRRVYTHLREGFATPKVHACVFDIATGELKELDWMNNKALSGYAEQYDAIDQIERSDSKVTLDEFEEYPKRPNTRSSTTTLQNKMYNRLPAGLSIRPDTE